MKKVIKAAGISLVVLTSSVFANAAEAAQKIGYISTGYVVQNMPQREAIITKLQEELKDDRAELDKLGASIQTKQQKIERDGSLLGDDGVQKLRIEIEQLKVEGKVKQNDYNKKVKALEYRAQAEMMKLIQKATKEVAEKEGFDMVMDAQSLQFAKPELNLTEKVLAGLK
ncbi:OmpH family outer membrane protein [Vibrio hannami]|uniref:OmpH family outer membrane protein n=1 Tax=Vibrio hannami TaxID=2717094 RepID=UPI00240EDFE6|nr:OmpH family outer membrane protein [Vibrio hannami]MDG3088861.1 OmpH family outer membrane protein [Vibrio hannami]